LKKQTSSAIKFLQKRPKVTKQALSIFKSLKFCQGQQLKLFFSAVRFPVFEFRIFFADVKISPEVSLFGLGLELPAHFRRQQRHRNLLRPVSGAAQVRLLYHLTLAWAIRPQTLMICLSWLPNIF